MGKGLPDDIMDFPPLLGSDRGLIGTVGAVIETDTEGILVAKAFQLIKFTAICKDGSSTSPNKLL